MTVTEDDALRTLNLIRGSSAEQVRDAYLDLVKVWHPDRFQGDERLRARAEQQIRTINQAYSVLASTTPTSEPVSPSSAATSGHKRPPEPERPFAAAPSKADAPAQFPLAKAIALGVALGVAFATAAANVPIVMRLSQRTSVAPQLTTSASPASSSAESSPTPDLPPATASLARPESGTEVLAPQRMGGGSLVVTNGSRDDAVLALATARGYERAVFVRAGEQVTVANVGAGLYQVQMMMGRDWVAGRFTRGVTYQELDSPVEFVEKTEGKVTEYTRLTVSVPTAAQGVRGIRTTQPFRVSLRH